MDDHRYLEEAAKCLETIEAAMVSAVGDIEKQSEVSNWIADHISGAVQGVYPASASTALSYSAIANGLIAMARAHLRDGEARRADFLMSTAQLFMRYASVDIVTCADAARDFEMQAVQIEAENAKLKNAVH